MLSKRAAGRTNGDYFILDQTHLLFAWALGWHKLPRSIAMNLGLNGSNPKPFSLVFPSLPNKEKKNLSEKKIEKKNERKIINEIWPTAK